MEPWIAGRNPVRLKDCGWESRCSHPDPDGLGHSLSHVAAGHYCKKHMLHPFLPFIFARPASPPVRHSGQLTSHASSSTMGGIGLRPAITTIAHASHAPTHTTSLASTAWLDMDAHRLTHCLGPRDRKDFEGPRICPGPSSCGTIGLPPAGSCAGNMGKFSKMGHVLFTSTKIEERTGPPFSQPKPAHDRLTGLDICFQRRRRVDSFPAFLHSFSPRYFLLPAVCGLTVCWACLVVW